MSAYTPPPYQYDRKAERRAAALASRAERDSRKAEREQFRQQMRARRRRSIVSPLLLVATGVVALLVSTGRWPLLGFAAWYAHWWPLLLVAAGLIMLGEWVLDRYAAHGAGAADGLRRSNGGVIWMIVPLALIGLTMRTVHDRADFLRNGFSFNQDNLLEVFSDKRTLPTQILDEAVPLTFAAGTTLTIDDPHGDITVAGKSPDGNLHITVSKQVFGGGGQAESRGDQLTPIFEQSGSAFSLRVPAVSGGTADLSLLVPDTLELSLNAGHGALSVSGMKAPVTLSASHGDMEVRAIAGNVTARLDSSNAGFGAHNVTGDVLLRGKAGDVNISDVTGQTHLDGDFYGDTHFEHLRSPLTFQTSRTHFTLARLDGTVDLDHSDISGSDLVGPVNLRVHSRNLSFDRVSGDLYVQNSNGSVEVTAAGGGNVTIENTNGAVSISLPEHTGLAIEADTHGGTIDNQFGLPVTKSREDSSMHGVVGDGRLHVTLRTTHADIRVNKLTAAGSEEADR